MRISDWSSDVCSSDLIAMRMKWALLHTAMAWAVPVAAQTEPDSEKADGAEIVVVGSRGAPRLVTESAVPVDVLSKDAQAGGGQCIKMGAKLTAFVEAPRVSIARSEEHTSELQSLMRISYAVFCLKTKRTVIIKK